MKCYLFLLLFAGVSHDCVAQACKYFPADCPETRADPFGSAEDSVSRLENPVIPAEITMENRLRSRVSEWMSSIASKEGWEVVQLSEDLASGERDAGSNVLAYSLRPPHWMVFRFQFVVNADSLRAWGLWFQEFAQRRLDNARAGKSDAGFDAERNRQRVHFRDASMLVVEVGFNMDIAKTIGGVALPPAGGEAMWMSNGNPDPIAVDLMNRSRNCALLLRGDWKRNPMGGGYVPDSAKKIRCDQVKTIDVHFSGNAAAIRRCLAGLPVAEMDGMIGR